MKKIYLPLFIFTATLVYAQTGNNALKKIQNKFNSLSDFSAAFNQVVMDENGKTTVKLNGSFFYKRKNKFVVELKNQLIVSNADLIWNYDKRQKRVVISYFEDDPTSFSLEKYIFDYPKLCRIKIIKNGNEEIINLIPKDDNLEFTDIKIWADNDNMVRRLELTDIGGVMYQIEFNDIKINQQIEDSKFNFNPPKGTRIIDLR